jgi:hypothetical protein
MYFVNVIIWFLPSLYLTQSMFFRVGVVTTRLGEVMTRRGAILVGCGGWWVCKARASLVTNVVQYIGGFPTDNHGMEKLQRPFSSDVVMLGTLEVGVANLKIVAFKVME